MDALAKLGKLTQAKRSATKKEIESRPQRPTPLRVDWESIPAELQCVPQWVTWKYEFRKPKAEKGKEPKPGKWTKCPKVARHHTATDPAPASSTDPETWATFGQAFFACVRFGDAPTVGVVDGIGFVFADTDPYCGVDLDDSVDPGTGELLDWARPIVADLNTYTEVSPSGTGVKMILRGRVPGDRK